MFMVDSFLMRNARQQTTSSFSAHRLAAGSDKYPLEW
jgi:hypothetical protein